jgi:ferredoxin, 2Fe-2S
MAEIVFHHDGRPDDVLVVAAGTTVMRAAVNGGVDGIIGECGGQAMCATCHVYVSPQYLDQLPPMSSDEDEMLEEAAAPRDRVRSRLGCQIPLTGTLERLEVHVPEVRA